eukprot:SAG31_NODE_189_length_20842_cov_12.518151_12_plen_144_part_00
MTMVVLASLQLEIQLRDEILSKSTQIASLHERTYQLDELVESMQNLASTGSLEDLNKSAEPAPDIQNLGQDRRGHSVSANASGAGAHDVEAGGTDRALPSEHEEERLPIEIKLAVLKSTLQVFARNLQSEQSANVSLCLCRQY